MATVKEAVKESLIGTTVEPALSQQSRATFQKHAREDEEGEYFMTEDDFVNAIAPESEDYVCWPASSIRFSSTCANGYAQ